MLERHYKRVNQSTLRQFFEGDPKRAAELTVDSDGLVLDYSKNLVDSSIVASLVQLAEARGVRVDDA